MPRLSRKSLAALALSFLALWLGVKYLLPLALPFLFGAGLALVAEPAVRFLSRRFRLKRGLAAPLGVAATILFLSALLLLAASLLLKELTALAGALPDLESAAERGLMALQDLLLQLADRTPDNIRLLLTRTVLDLFQGGAALLSRLTGQLGALISGAVTHIPDGFLKVGTGLLAAFMISVRLPRLKRWFKRQLPENWIQKYLPALRGLRHALGGWLKAQLKLSGTTFAIVLLGFLLLRVTYAPVWAAVVALVDAVPILGTGTVLLPWALVCFLRGSHMRALGLLALYAAAALTRTVLEPRFLGKHLGLDPLVTLICLYAGYRFWGIGGMLLSPMLAVAAMQLSSATDPTLRDPNAGK